MKSVYDTFAFDFELCLSTRPDKYMGERSQWDEAEAQLKETMDAFGKVGAFALFALVSI